MMNKLEDCIDNQKRRSALGEKFALPSEDMSPKKRRKTARDSLGCINWQPVDLPVEKPRNLSSNWNPFLLLNSRKINQMTMSHTYATQRFFINAKRSVTEIRREWPFLLHENYILSHFEALIGKDVLKLFRQNLPIKCKKIWEFMTCQNSKQRLSECVKYINQSKERLQNSTPEILHILKKMKGFSFRFLMLYFL